MDLKLKPCVRQLLVFRAYYALEPGEELKSESWEDEKFDESRYRKKVDALSLRSAFEF